MQHRHLFLRLMIALLAAGLLTATYVLVGTAGLAPAPAQVALEPQPDASSSAVPASATPISLPPPSPTPSPAAPEQPSATPAPTELPPASSTATPTLLPAAERAELFVKVWETVHEQYLYEDFRGVDWAAQRKIYEPRALQASSAEEFYSVLGEMVDQLSDQHSRYLSPWEAAEEDALAKGTDAYVGIGILAVHEAETALVQYVFPDSPAAEVGLQRRDRIIAVNGLPYSANSEIRGPEGSSVQVTVRSPEQEPRELTIARRAIIGKIRPSSARLEIDPQIGYLFIPSLWADDMAAQVEQELAGLLAQEPLRGLVIDLRGNGGGWRTVLEGILSQFVIGEVGRFYSQEQSYPLVIHQGKLYEQLKGLPLVVLLDRNTESYAEVLAGALQSTVQAQVIGTASAGNTETIYPYSFEDGSRLWVAQEGFRLPNGTNLEGRGVSPDLQLGLDWAEYPMDSDPEILKAVELLRAPAGR